MDLFEKVKELCNKKGINITKLEKQLSFGSSSILNWKKSSPSIDKVAKVAKYFNVSADYLLGLNIKNIGQTELHYTQKAILEHANNIGISETLELLQGYEKLKDKQKGRILGNINALSNNSDDFEAAEEFEQGGKIS